MALCYILFIWNTYIVKNITILFFANHKLHELKNFLFFSIKNKIFSIKIKKKFHINKYILKFINNCLVNNSSK